MYSNFIVPCLLRVGRRQGEKATKWLPRLHPKVRATIEGLPSGPVLPAAWAQLWLLSRLIGMTCAHMRQPGEIWVILSEMAVHGISLGKSCPWKGSSV